MTSTTANWTKSIPTIRGGTRLSLMTMSAIHNPNKATFGHLSDRFVFSSIDSDQTLLPMHTTDLLNEIHRLVRAGELSQREIAAHLEVSRGTVGAIASGRRSLVGREPRRTYS